MQLGGGAFDLFNLRQRELVIGVFTPVGLAVHGVETEPELGRFSRQSGRSVIAIRFMHQPPMLREPELEVALLRCMLLCLATVSPKPPRVTVLVTAGFGAMAVFGTVMVRPPAVAGP